MGIVYSIVYSIWVFYIAQAKSRTGEERSDTHREKRRFFSTKFCIKCENVVKSIGKPYMCR